MMVVVMGNAFARVDDASFASVKDGFEGWRFDKSKGYMCGKVFVPKDFDSKKAISRDDITNLVIELNNVKDVEGLINSPVLFAQSYKTEYK